MKIVIIGGTGLIGTKLTGLLRERGYEVVAASPSSGVNAVTGDGLAEVLRGADVVVDVANSPSFEDTAVMEFFQASGRNLLRAEADAGVGHHVALSVVGADRMPALGYMRAKVAQEELIRNSPVPYTIVRATQFFEFADSLVHQGADGGTVRLSPVLMQPIAARDVAEALAEAAVGDPVKGAVEVAGPEQMTQDELARRLLAARHDERQVFSDGGSTYFGSPVDEGVLVPAGPADLGATRYEDWLTADATA